MGKDLKGKELGTGISQRNDGRYMARFSDNRGVRHTYYSNNLKNLEKKLLKNNMNLLWVFMEQGSINIK